MSLHKASKTKDIESLQKAINKSNDLNERKGRKKLAALHEAIQAQYYEGASLLLASGADVNVRDGTQRTPLQIAAEAGDLEAIKLLLEAGASVDAYDERRSTPLHLACWKGALDCVEHLVEAGADPSFVGDWFTTLHGAASENRVDVMRFLLEQGVPIDILGEDDETPLFRAAYFGKVDALNFLLANGANPNHKNRFGWNALKRAGGRRKKTIIKILQGFSDPNEALMSAVENKDLNGLKAAITEGATFGIYDSQTPLHMAVRYIFNQSDARRSVQMIEYMFECWGDTIDLEMGDSLSYTPLQLAIRPEALDVVKCLLDHGSDINGRGYNEQTPLCTALNHSECDHIVQELLARGADIELRGRFERTPLYWAAYNANETFVEELLKRGAEVDALDNRKTTPLFSICYFRPELKLAEMLFEAGADVNIVNDYGVTMLQEAAERGYAELVGFLLEHGADPDAVNAEGKSALALAKERNHTNVIQLLEGGAGLSSEERQTRAALQKELSEAVKEKNVEALDALLAQGIVLNFVDEDDYSKKSPLQIAISAYESSDEIIERLIDAEGDLHLTDNCGKTAFSYAVVDGKLKHAKRMLKKGFEPTFRNVSGETILFHLPWEYAPARMAFLLGLGVDINATDNWGRTTLHMSASRDVKIVEQLLKAGADPNITDEDGETVLHTAAEYGNKAQNVALLKAGADPNVAASDGRTPFAVACHGNKKAVAAAMLKHGANINGAPGSDPPLLNAAYYSGRGKIFQWLLEEGADLHVRNSHGANVLHMAANNSDGAGYVKQLIDLGLDVNDRDHRGSVPLHSPALWGYNKPLRCLLEHNAEPNSQNDEGSTPLHEAASLGQDSTCTILLSFGADRTLTDNDGRTPAELAREREHPETAQLIDDYVSGA